MTQGEKNRIEAMRVANKKRWEEYRKNRVTEDRICPICGETYNVIPTHSRIKKTCSRKCGMICAGSKRRGKKYEEIYGDRAEEMKKRAFAWRWGDDGRTINEPYQINDDWYIRFEEDGEIKTERYHRWLWEKENGPLPKGYVIHHINLDHNDNRIENLECVSRAEHMKIHNNIRNGK